MSWLRSDGERGAGQAGIDAYFKRQSEALEGKTIKSVREGDGGTVIEFTDGSSFQLPIMPWNWEPSSDEDAG